MPHAYLLQDIAIVVAAAGLMTLLCHLLRQPVVLGYLIAGIIIGPHTPPFALVHDLHSIHTMAELGLVFLMFVLGLEFNLPRLRKVGFSAALATALEVSVMLWMGYSLGQWFGWNQKDSVFLGAILSISSTTIIVKALSDMRLTGERFTQVVFGILILEDIVAVLILSVLSGLGTADAANTAVALRALLRMGFFIVLFLVVGLATVPRLLHWTASFQSKEMLGVFALAFCLSGAVLASLLGFSVALGAFLMGAVIAASRESHAIEEWMRPVRDLFSAIFFVSVGLMIQPAHLWTYKGQILMLAFAILLGKTFAVTLGAFLAGYGTKTSFKIGVSMAQIGEFSFVIAGLGAALNITSDFLRPLAVAVSGVTAFLAPYLIRNSETIVEGTLNAAPVRLRSTLDRYESWMKTAREKNIKSRVPAPVPGYVIRLIVYGALLLAVVLAVQLAAKILHAAVLDRFPLVQPLLWMSAAILALPLFMAVSKYVNHIALVLMTKALVTFTLFGHINIHYLYRTLQVAVISALGAGTAFFAADYMGGHTLAGLAALTAGVGIVVKKTVSNVNERMEKILDEIFGLATSEPSHQAAVLASQKTPIEDHLAEQIVLREGSPAARRTIRALGVREQTGATIVSIYRAGGHMTNPSPETTLLPNDVIVVWGNEEQRKKASNLFFPQDPS